MTNTPRRWNAPTSKWFRRWTLRGAVQFPLPYSVSGNERAIITGAPLQRQNATSFVQRLPNRSNSDTESPNQSDLTGPVSRLSTGQGRNAPRVVESAIQQRFADDSACQSGARIRDCETFQGFDPTKALNYWSPLSFTRATGIRQRSAKHSPVDAKNRARRLREGCRRSTPRPVPHQSDALLDDRLRLSKRVTTSDLALQSLSSLNRFYLVVPQDCFTLSKVRDDFYCGLNHALPATRQCVPS